MLVKYDPETNRLVSVLIPNHSFLVHAADKCAGEFCCIHNPSSHSLDNAPMNWRTDRGIMERICPHGIGHNDPDDTAARKKLGLNDSEGIHGCDGCCIGVIYG